MEFCDSSLDNCFPKCGEPKKYQGPLPTTFTMLHQLAQGLQYIHSKNIVHRDIKPGNVLISRGPPCLLKWGDFGLSKPVSDHGSFSLSGVKGTEIWLAPEIQILLKKLRDNLDAVKTLEISKMLEGERGNISSDLFSAGCLFFFLFFGGTRHLFGDPSEIPANIVKYGDSEDNKPINLDSELRFFLFD